MVGFMYVPNTALAGGSRVAEIYGCLRMAAKTHSLFLKALHGAGPGRNRDGPGNMESLYTILWMYNMVLCGDVWWLPQVQCKSEFASIECNYVMHCCSVDAGLLAARKQKIEAEASLHNRVNYQIAMDTLGFSSLTTSLF